MKKIENEDSVEIAVFDQCCFGLVSPKEKRPMMKRTKIMTNCKFVYQSLHGHFCDGSHVHAQIQGSEGGVKLSQHAQIYPDALVKTLCEGIMRSV